MSKYQLKRQVVEVEFFYPERTWPAGIKKDDCHPKGPIVLDRNDGTFEGVVAGDIIVTGDDGKRAAWKRHDFDRTYEPVVAPSIPVDEQAPPAEPGKMPARARGKVTEAKT